MVMSRMRPHSVAHHGGGDVDLDRDRALVRRCQEGDGGAFAELYTEYHERLHRFCVRRLPDREEAEEVTQEAFLRAWRALPTFSGDLRFYPWLTVIAKNLCTDALRRRARYGELADLDRHEARDATRFDLAGTAISSEEAVMASFDGQLAAEAMTRLSPRHRHVLALREEDGLSYQQIAAAEGVEISAVETLLWRARQALKREYAALSGTRVLGGILGLGAGLRRLAERAGRRAMRTAAVASRFKVRDLALAGAVTVALASVAATSGTQPGASPAPPAVASTGGGTPPGAVHAPWSAVATTVSGPSAAALPPAPTASASASASASTPGSPSVSGPGTIRPVSLPGAPAAQVPPPLSAVATQVPTIVSTITSTLKSVTGNLPGPGNLPGSLPRTPSTLKGLLSGPTSLFPKL